MVALLQVELAVVFLLILVFVGIIGAVLFFGVFGAAARRNPDRPGGEGDGENEERGRDDGAS